ncbi:Purine nucleoside phosphorylase [Mycena venus]|uniref:Purine nucleoside phosphorylase n=1 Tax=Mycena venus TaxID=2733690 RepID=A0A8H6XQG9_9AGAR|nr:Purine nucleoside phosphorylase [Mycena venus]
MVFFRHLISPSKSVIPAHTNFAALKHLSVRIIIAFSVVSSLHEVAQSTLLCLRSSSITPRTCAHLIFRQYRLVVLAGFSNPSLLRLAAWLADAVQALKAERRAVKLWTKKTLGVMEGLQFSTCTESLIYRQ